MLAYCDTQRLDRVFSRVRHPHAAIDPRAFNDHYEVFPTLIRQGASVGANATIVCGVTLGRYCMVGAGAVVTHDVPEGAVVAGVPARLTARQVPR